MTMATEAGIRTPDVCQLTGITYRELDYWARTDVVRPSIQDAKGQGSARLYSVEDIVLLSVMKHLRDHGVSLDAIRAVVPPVRSALGLGANATLWLVLGEQIEVTTTLESVVRGGRLFTVVDLARVVAETADSLIEWQKTRQVVDEPAE